MRITRLLSFSQLSSPFSSHDCETGAAMVKVQVFFSLQQRQWYPKVGKTVTNLEIYFSGQKNNLQRKIFN